MKWMRQIAAPALCAVAALAFGCASGRPGDVPTTADTVGDGSQQLVYTARGDGSIWVTDAADNSIVYTGPVHSGDVVTLDPDNDRLSLNGRILSNNNINHDEHKIYFLEGETIAPPPSNMPNANVQRPTGVSEQALLKGEGSDLVRYTVSSKGMVWVTDASTNTILYSGRVAAGDEIVVDPNNNSLAINGNKVLSQGLSHNNHQIFFLPSDGMSGPGMND